MNCKHVFVVLLMICLSDTRNVFAETAVAVAPGNILVIFDTATPGTITTRAVTGLGANETIRGIDVRPNTGQVYVSTVTTASANNSVVSTYTINPTTGVATFVGQTPAALPAAADIATGYDFNPTVTVDRIRYNNSGVNDENARLNPNNGTLSGNDTDLTPAATTDIIAAAYDRNSFGTTQTTLYVIDRNGSQIGIQGGINVTPSPNGGVVTDLAPLGFTVGGAADGGFDVAASGTAYAALTDAATGLTGLYTLVLPTAVTATPAATFVGIIGTGGQIFSLTILAPDADSDGVGDPYDNCPGAANTDQADGDADGDGDMCDNCPSAANADQADGDGDGRGDVCDNCPQAANPDQANADGDARADACDNCPAVANDDQSDSDGNGVGDACPPASACGTCGPGVATMMPAMLLVLALRHHRRGRRNSP